MSTSSSPTTPTAPTTPTPKARFKSGKEMSPDSTNSSPTTPTAPTKPTSPKPCFKNGKEMSPDPRAIKKREGRKKEREEKQRAAAEEAQKLRALNAHKRQTTRLKHKQVDLEQSRVALAQSEVDLEREKLKSEEKKLEHDVDLRKTALSVAAKSYEKYNKSVEALALGKRSHSLPQRLDHETEESETLESKSSVPSSISCHSTVDSTSLQSESEHNNSITTERYFNLPSGGVTQAVASVNNNNNDNIRAGRASTGSLASTPSNFAVLRAYDHQDVPCAATSLRHHPVYSGTTMTFCESPVYINNHQSRHASTAAVSTPSDHHQSHYNPFQSQQLVNSNNNNLGHASASAASAPSAALLDYSHHHSPFAAASMHHQPVYNNTMMPSLDFHNISNNNNNNNNNNRLSSASVKTPPKYHPGDPRAAASLKHQSSHDGTTMASFGSPPNNNNGFGHVSSTAVAAASLHQLSSYKYPTSPTDTQRHSSAIERGADQDYYFSPPPTLDPSTPKRKACDEEDDDNMSKKKKSKKKSGSVNVVHVGVLSGIPPPPDYLWALHDNKFFTKLIDADLSLVEFGGSGFQYNIEHVKIRGRDRGGFLTLDQMYKEMQLGQVERDHDGKYYIHRYLDNDVMLRWPLDFSKKSRKVYIPTMIAVSPLPQKRKNKLLAKLYKLLGTCENSDVLVGRIHGLVQSIRECDMVKLSSVDIVTDLLEIFPSPNDIMVCRNTQYFVAMGHPEAWIYFVDQINCAAAYRKLTALLAFLRIRDAAVNTSLSTHDFMQSTDLAVQHMIQSWHR